MRAARLVGLSQDGTSLIVATDDGEEFALPVDERLRAALRGDRPRLGQLEIEMESVLSPRDIQARIRAGASLDEVVRISGMPADRVERFAGPVLLERQHMAGQAMASSVRRRGETSGHRNLRVAVTERLSDRGIDPDTVTWDARRMDDGRWAVTAEYRSGEASRTAEFHFDPRGRYSLAGNDEARWVLGEPGPAKAAPPPRRRPLRAVDDDFVDEAAEPTLDLNDELALVRAVQVDEPDPIDGRVQVDERDRVDEPERDDEPEYDLPERARSRGRDNGRHRPTARTQDERRYQDDRDVRRDPPRRRGLRRVDPDHQPDDLTRQGFGSDEPDEAAAGIPDDHRPSAYEEADQDTELQTLYGMLGGEGYAEDSVTIYPGLREEGPVGWEPEIVVDQPDDQPTLTEADETPGEPTEQSEPELPALSITEAAPEPTRPVRPDRSVRPDQPVRPDGPVRPEKARGTDRARPEQPELDPAVSEAVGAAAEAEPAAESPQAEPSTPAGQPEPAPAKPKRSRKKRASVPSWDEIMFGGPPRKPRKNS